MKKKVIAILTGLSVLMCGSICFADAVTGSNSDVGASSASTSNIIRFSQSNSVQITLSTDDVNFGEINSVLGAESPNVTLKINSSLPYDVNATPTGDFTSGLSSLPINKLSVKVDSGEYSNFTIPNESKEIISSAPATCANDDQMKEYTIKYKLDPTVGGATGEYSVPITYSVIQK